MCSQAFHQRFVRLAERLHGRAESFAQAGHFDGAAGELRGHGAELAGFRFDVVGEAGADAFKQIGRGDDQGIDGFALLGGGMVHRVEQRFQRGQQAAALFQHGGVADHAFGELLAQLGDDFGRGLRGFRCRGLHESRDLGDGFAGMRLGLRGNIAPPCAPACRRFPAGGSRRARPPAAHCWPQRGGHRAQRLRPGGQSLLRRARPASVCRSACDWLTVRTSEVACCSKVVAASAKACWLRVASASLAACCCDSACVQRLRDVAGGGVQLRASRSPAGRPSAARSCALN